MTVHTHIVDKNKHREFLKEERIDPFTKERIKAGDKIVFCAKCKTAYLRGSWEIMAKAKSCKNCDQTQTLSEFPQVRSKIKFEKKSTNHSPSNSKTEYNPSPRRTAPHRPTPPPASLSKRILLFLLLFVLFTGFIITLTHQKLLNIPFIEELLWAEPVMIMTGAGVKLRRTPHWKTKTVKLLQIGTIVRPLENRQIKGEYWYRVVTPTDKKGWVPGKYTMSIDFHERKKAYVVIAKKKLNGKANYGDLVELRNFLNRVSKEVTQAEIAKELKQLHSLTLQQLKKSSPQ